MNENEKLKASFLSPYKIVFPFLENQKPVTIEVHPCFPCNYSCEWCIDRALKEIGLNKDNDSIITKEGVDEIIRFAIERGVRGIVVSGGGEPTITENTEYLVKEADENDIRIGMFTNGSLLTNDTIKTYIDHLSFIRFSFDDFSSENYSKTKGVPERFYGIVINNIKKCVKYKKESGNKRCRIGIDFILIPSNVDKMEEIYEEAKKIGVDYLQFCDCVIIGYEFTQTRKKTIKKKLKEILKLKQTDKCKMDVVYEPIQMENRTYCRDCEVKEFIVQVGADGGVRPCPHTARRDEMLYGNIYDKSLSELWDNRPEKIDSDLLYENCRFRRQNEILKGLKKITHAEMI